ncbi:Carboxylesterase NlhH [compost metagenome]
MYAPANAQNADVLIFVHGGEWDTGNKNIYGRLGINFAKRNIVFVAINYRLAPTFSYEDMGLDVARAIKWVYNNIENYGGNASRIFLSGHSAGGYLSALTGLDNRYFQQAKIGNPLKGLILIDSFLLDLYEFFTINGIEFGKKYYPIFGDHEQSWKKATPINYLKNCKLPIQAFLGSLTYPGILIGTERLRKQCELEGVKLEFNIIWKKAHRAMISQMFMSKNPMYNYIIDFMKRTG